VAWAGFKSDQDCLSEQTSTYLATPQSDKYFIVLDILHILLHQCPSSGLLWNSKQRNDVKA